jgi:hypothetical protein
MWPGRHTDTEPVPEEAWNINTWFLTQIVVLFGQFCPQLPLQPLLQLDACSTLVSTERFRLVAKFGTKLTHNEIYGSATNCGSFCVGSAIVVQHIQTLLSFLSAGVYIAVACNSSIERTRLCCVVHGSSLSVRVVAGPVPMSDVYCSLYVA